MGRLKLIEQALIGINEAVFQDLCNSFLVRTNSNYSTFSSPGSQEGKQKTTKGTPDSFFLLPSGNYIFVEHSTNISEGVKKLKKDVEKCLDSTKTKIPHSKIDEIILCFNFKLNAAEVNDLKKMVKGKRIKMSLNNLHDLATELHLNHRDLVQTYLGLPIDTGQIVSIEQYIEEYEKGSQGIATKLSNEFLHREDELARIMQALERSDFLILTGQPGVGKTKLAIETIRNLSDEAAKYSAYAVSNKSADLLDDLYTHLDANTNNIIFVDDANRIDRFSQISGYYQSKRKGQLKVIITVRDYALSVINNLCVGFSPEIIPVSKFDDEQIKALIESNDLEILNQDYQKDIVRIADGNARLAIMTALLAKENQDISVLRNVSDLFETYYSTFVKDEGAFGDPTNMKCLGLIAFFYTLPYKDESIMDPILASFDITRDEFIEAIDRLELLELVTIQYDNVKVQEQNLSVFFFFKSFIQEDLLSFQILLEEFFNRQTKERFRECLVPATNTLGAETVIEKIRPILSNYWQAHQNDDEVAQEFMSLFWYFLQDECLAYCYSRIESIPQCGDAHYETKYDANDFSYMRDPIFELLDDFFRYSNKEFSTAVELAFAYVSKEPAKFPLLLHTIRTRVTYDRTDYKFGFFRQRSLFDYIIDNIENGEIYEIAFLELATTFMGFSFHQDGGMRGNTYSFYNYRVPVVKPITDLRGRILSIVEERFSMRPEQSMKVIENYGSGLMEAQLELIQSDVHGIITIMEECMDRGSFEHCLVVQDRVQWLEKKGVSDPRLTVLKDSFVNELYDTYVVIDWNRLANRESLEWSDWREYETLKEESICKKYVFNNLDDFMAFYAHFESIYEIRPEQQNLRSLEVVLESHLEQSFDAGYLMLKHMVDTGNKCGFVPNRLFQRHCSNKEQAIQLWTVIDEIGFQGQEHWKVSYFNYVTLDAIGGSEGVAIEALVHTIKNATENLNVYFDHYERFLEKEPHLFEFLLKEVVENNRSTDGKIQLWDDLFAKHFESLGPIGYVKEAYLQQCQIQQYFDTSHEGLKRIVDEDGEFLFEFLTSFENKYGYPHPSEANNWSFVWQYQDAESRVARAISQVADHEYYHGISDHFANVFFKGLDEDATGKRADEFLLDYLRKNLDSSNRVNAVIDIVRTSRKGIYDDALLLYIAEGPSVDQFQQIWWRGNGGTVWNGDVIIADIEAADWTRIRETIKGANLGIKALPIIDHINAVIQSCLEKGDAERKQKFVSGREY